MLELNAARVPGIFLPDDTYDIEDDIERAATYILNIVVHEECHQICRVETKKTVQQRGFETVKRVPETHGFEFEFSLFNEGMTELIKDAVIDEYIRRTGDSKKFLDAFDTLYLEGRYLVNDIVKNIAQETGVSEDMVKEALVRQYIHSASLKILAKEIQESSGIDVSDFENPDENVLTEKLQNMKHEDYVTAVTNWGKRALTK